jgi:hypothetical protein
MGVERLAADPFMLHQGEPGTLNIAWAAYEGLAWLTQHHAGVRQGNTEHYRSAASEAFCQLCSPVQGE